MITVKKIRPMFTSVVTTMDKYGVDELKGSIIDPTKAQGSIKEFQKVIAVGPMVHSINVGDMVCIDPKRYAVYKYREDSVKNDLLNNEIVGFNIPQVEIDGQTYMNLTENDIVYVVEEYEEVQPDSGIVHEEKHIIVP